MMRSVCACFLAVMLFACNKKEPVNVVGAASRAVAAAACEKQVVAEKPVKVGETGIMLPVGTKICISSDQMEVRVELPPGYAFLSKDDQGAMEKTLPVYATYSCACSVSGSACNVFYIDGMGFGCLQSSCSGSCTGKFTYKGYSVDRVISMADKYAFFSDATIQKQVEEMTKNVSTLEAYGKFSVMGISFYLVQDEKVFLAKASCDCEGTQACKLRTISLPFKTGTQGKKIYFCEGGCNGCELTV